MVFIINKKRILAITICLVFSFLFAGIKGKSEIIETVALPVENKVIIIDARTWISRYAEHLVMRE